MFKDDRESIEEYEEIWYTHNTILYMKKMWRDKL